MNPTPIPAAENCPPPAAKKRRRASPRVRQSPGPEETASRGEQKDRPSLLQRLDDCAAECERVESLLGGRGVPELETIIKLHRMLILRFSLEAEIAPEMLKLVDGLMKPVMDWARMEEKRKERELAEQKYRDQLEADKAARAAETSAAGAGALQPGTLEIIEQELSLL